jgi:large subunit ribosomal protein L17
MRHGKKFNHLGRKSSHRKAMLSNMAGSLIMHKRIRTTLAKAKALRVYIEPLITKSKKDTMHSRRTVFSYLKNKYVLKELFGSVSEKIYNRPGGYLRIIKLQNRLGDNAKMALVEFVDFNEVYNLKASTDVAPKKKTRRSSGSKKVETAAEVQPKETTAEAEENKSEE